MYKIGFVFMILSLTANAAFAQKKTGLKYRKFIDGQVQLKVPGSFTIMGETMMDYKYPNLITRPEKVYTNESGSINVAVLLTENKVTESQLSSISENTKKVMQITFKEVKIFEEGNSLLRGKPVYFLKIQTPAIDTNIYNHMVFFELQGKLVICTFNCKENQVSEWKPIAERIMNSLKIKKG